MRYEISPSHLTLGRTALTITLLYSGHDEQALYHQVPREPKATGPTPLHRGGAQMVDAEKPPSAHFPAVSSPHPRLVLTSTSQPRQSDEEQRPDQAAVS